MSETKRYTIRNLQHPKDLVILNALYENAECVLASDYERDLAEMRRQRDEALTRVAELEVALKELVTLKDWKDKYGRDLVYQRDQPLAWDKARDALTTKEPRDG